MKLKEAIDLLEYYQAWRAGAKIWPVKPEKITEAINIVLEEVKRENSH